MTGRSPAGPLMHEHRVIERMIAILARQLESIDVTGRADPAVIDAATDFIRTYADRCHHGKEEDILFRRLAEKELDEALAEEMASLLEDHVRGRALTRLLADANRLYATGDATALADVRMSARELVDFYPVHIEKEDHHFFRLCLEYFSDAEKVEMLREFDEFDRALIHEKYLSVVERLEGAT